MSPGGRVGKASSFVLLQELSGQIKIPYWIQGGIGLRSAAAAVMAGATGVVLGEQLWLTEEGPCVSAEQRAAWSQLDGSETIVLGEALICFVFQSTRSRQATRTRSWPSPRATTGGISLRRLLLGRDDPLIPLGQDIAFAAPSLGRRYGTTGRVSPRCAIASIAPAIGEAVRKMCCDPLRALAKLHGTRFPIVQGPMTRVSDVAPFADAVAEAEACRSSRSR